MINWTRYAAAAACVAAAAVNAPASAALGGAADSVRADAVALHSQLAPRAASQSAYSVQSLTLANGTVVNEYVSAAGAVFALHWEGARAPDLAQLLGAYFTDYQAASSIPHPRQSQLRINTARLAYHGGGHMRALWGTAYVPALLPAGLSMEDVK